MATKPKPKRKRSTQRKCYQLDDRTIKLLGALQQRYKASSESETVRRVVEELDKVYRCVEGEDGGDLGILLTDVR